MSVEKENSNFKYRYSKGFKQTRGPVKTRGFALKEGKFRSGQELNLVKYSPIFSYDLLRMSSCGRNTALKWCVPGTCPNPLP